MAFIDEKIVLEGVTFDDVLLIPAYYQHGIPPLPTLR